MSAFSGVTSSSLTVSWTSVAGSTYNAVLSTATFHWVLDHDALFRNLARVLRRGGRLEAQCGGAGNIAFFHALVMGGKASIVGPVTALFPLVTVILAVTLLHERIGTAQKIGLALALAAIYLLSM